MVMSTATLVTVGMALLTMDYARAALPSDPSFGLNTTAGDQGAGFTTVTKAEDAQKNLNNAIGTIVNIALSLTGVVFLLMVVAAGDLWMTAGGNEEKITKARGMIFNGVVGIAIVYASYLAVSFVIKVFIDASGA